MIDTNENIFDYDLNELEQEVLNRADNDEASYLLLAPPLKILSDLHLLFLIRKDKVNRKRIIDTIKIFSAKLLTQINPPSLDSSFPISFQHQAP